ncbi:histidine phosphatase family protein [Streptomyces sp. NPDC059443]|uniref:histidine phosphatase family protein n=1 Tax=unclassified Streptomyces TaxID=2593676 RepID=UPI00369DA440
MSLLLAGCGSKGEGDATPRSEQVTSPSPGTTPRADGTGGSGSGDLVVMIIRHGEKPTGSEPGKDDNGKRDSHSLTDRGWARAEALPRLFAPQPAPGLVRPAKVYAATDQGPDAGGHRMRQTVTPLAKRLGLTVDLTYAESKEADLAAAVSASSGPVLICWEHSRIPEIVKALAPRSGAPAAWPDRFDLVWVFTRTAGTWSFKEVDEHLLDSDA